MVEVRGIEPLSKAPSKSADTSSFANPATGVEAFGHRQHNLLIFAPSPFMRPEGCCASGLHPDWGDDAQPECLMLAMASGTSSYAAIRLLHSKLSLLLAAWFCPVWPVPRLRRHLPIAYPVETSVPPCRCEAAAQLPEQQRGRERLFASSTSTPRSVLVGPCGLLEQEAGLEPAKPPRWQRGALPTELFLRDLWCGTVRLQ